MRNFIDFQWKVHREGYRVIESVNPWAPTRETERFLTDGLTASLPSAYRPYHPFRTETGLCIEFAAVDPTEAGILSFARAYGMLGDDMSIVLTDRKTPKGTPGGRGEPLALWYEEIRAMKDAVTLWDMLQKNARTKLADVIQWQNGHVHYVSPHHRERLEPPPPPLHRPPRFQPGEVVKPAWYYLQRTINRHLEPQRRSPHPRVSPALLWSRGPITLGLYLVPHSLIGAVWLQFALIVEEGRGYRLCMYCGKPFGIGPDAKRAHAAFCCPSHQKLAWQREQRRHTAKRRE